MKDQFVKAFEPELAVQVIHIGKSNKEALSMLGSLVQFITKDYYHLTDAQTSTIYLKKKGKEKS